MILKNNWDAMRPSKNEIAFQKKIKREKKNKPIVTQSGMVIWGTYK